MVQPPSYIKNADAVIKAFGYWPSFHDAPVLAFKYFEDTGGKVELALHGWEMTQEVDERGYFKLLKHHVVSFTFDGISEANLKDFTAENILFELEFSKPEDFQATGKFQVFLGSALDSDRDGSFSARAGEVVEVTPCDESGRPRIS